MRNLFFWSFFKNLFMQLYKVDNINHFQQHIILTAENKLHKWKGIGTSLLLQDAMDNLQIVLGMFPMMEVEYVEYIKNILKQYENLELPLRKLTSKIRCSSITISDFENLTTFTSLPLCCQCRWNFHKEFEKYMKKGKLYPQVIHDLSWFQVH